MYRKAHVINYEFTNQHTASIKEHILETPGAPSQLLPTQPLPSSLNSRLPSPPLPAPPLLAPSLPSQPLLSSGRVRSFGAWVL